LGAGNEYLRGALEKIGRYLGLGRGQTAGTNGRKMEDGVAEALAALKFLVEGEFWDVLGGIPASSASPESQQSSKYAGVRSHVSREVFDKDELYHRRRHCDAILDLAVSECCRVHHISNPHKALAVQVGGARGRKGARTQGMLAGLNVCVEGSSTCSVCMIQ
jgi:hypothetical protein